MVLREPAAGSSDTSSPLGEEHESEDLGERHCRLDDHTLHRRCSFGPCRLLGRETIIDTEYVFMMTAARCKVMQQERHFMPVGARCLHAAYERLALFQPHVTQAA